VSPIVSLSKWNKAVRYGTSFFSVYTVTKAKQQAGRNQGRVVDLPAGSFDLARPGVAQPLQSNDTENMNI